jgi:hypothetical protein
MKKQLLLSITLFICAIAFGQSSKYEAAMKKNLAAMDTSFKSTTALLNVANSFERIASAEKNQWLPYYYAAFCQVNLGFKEQDKDKVDGIADKASSLIAIADSLSPNNSEISCIKSMIASCHLMVNPMQRWMQYGKESSSNIENAMKQDSTNPRPYFLKGQGLKYTPEQFGGGCKTAKPALQTSMDKYAVFKPAGELFPNWGKEITQQLLDGCK